MKKIRIAQIGTSANSHGSVIFDTLKKCSDIFEIVGYSMPENEREKFPDMMKNFDNYKELPLDEILNDPTIEAVTVETEEMYLTKYALLASQHGKHVHMEKPGGTSIADFSKLISCVKNSEKVFHTGYMYRYNPYISEIVQQIKSGEFGDIISIEAQMNCIHPKELRSWLSNFDGGIMFFLGCHLVDIIYRLQGVPKKITAMNRHTGIDDATGEDFGLALFEYEHGVSFAKVSAVEMGGYARRQLVISGTKKTVELKPFERLSKEPPLLFTGKTEYTTSAWHKENGTYTETPPFNRYERMMRCFAEYVRGEKENPYTPDSELELYRILMIACGKE